VRAPTRSKNWHTIWSNEKSDSLAVISESISQSNRLTEGLTDRMTQSPNIAILAIAAHRDDVEQTCGGTLLKTAERGHGTAILDLTRGEMGTRGTAGDRAREATAAARILRVAWRGALDIPDGRVENTWENRLKVAAVVRQLRPRVVILPYEKGRHPDHYTASRLAYEACFLAGLKKLELPHELNIEISVGAPGGSTEPHRPFKIVYASLYYDVRPTFVVDISEQFEARLQALLAYRSQYEDQSAGAGVFPTRQQVGERIETMARYYGLLAGVRYAEPFVQNEIGLVEDLTALPVQSL
jgi:bacillithiol biosynthesis deacetylase BshB1